MRSAPQAQGQKLAGNSAQPPSAERLPAPPEIIAAAPNLQPKAPAPLALPSPDQNGSLAAALSAARHTIWALSEAEAALPANTGATHFAANPANDLTTRFLADGGVRIEPGRNDLEWEVEMRTEGTSGKVEADSSRAEFRRDDGVGEWFLNRPDGIEHGFTVPAPQQDPSRLHFEVTLDGLRAEHDPDSPGDLRFVDEQGVARLGYRTLKVWDADGNPLAAEMHPLPDGQGFEIAANATGARFPVTVDPLIVSLESTFTPNVTGDGSLGDNFGTVVALDGDTAAISKSPEIYMFTRSAGLWSLQQRIANSGGTLSLDGDTLAIANSSSDQVFVYRRNAGAWGLDATLTDSTLGGFGTSVAIAGGTLVVGQATGADAGRALVYTRSGGVWSVQATLEPNDPETSKRFGWSVDIDGDSCIVGTFPGGITPPLSAAYVFTRSGTTWSQQQKLEAPYIAFGDPDNSTNSFSHSVALSGDLALVADVGIDRVHLYTRPSFGAVWSEVTRLTTSDPDVPSQFGDAIDTDGTYVAVGATDSYGEGAVYLFNETTPGSGVWTERAKLSPDAGDVDGDFGSAVALDGSTVLVGNPDGDAATEAGNAYLFDNPVGLPLYSWPSEAILGLGNARQSSGLGAALAIEGDLAAVGAPNDDTPVAPDAGAVYLFERAGGNWVDGSVLWANDGVAEAEFGHDVGIAGGRVLVGAPASFASAPAEGAAYVFRNLAGFWSQAAKLSPPSGVDSDSLFGDAVALTADVAAVGAPEATSGGESAAGAVHVFRRTGASWNHEIRLGAPVPDPGDRFGSALAADGAELLVGVPGASDYDGTAHLFQDSGGSWSAIHSFPPGPNSIAFGTSLALNNGRAAIGAPESSDGGEIHLFGAGAGSWVTESVIRSVDNAAVDLGSDLDLDGDFLLAGAPAFYSSGDAKVVLFRRGEVEGVATWVTVTTILPPAGGEDFGASVALAGQTVLVGDPSAAGVDGSGNTVPEQGAAHAYEVDDSDVLYFFPAQGGGLSESDPSGTAVGSLLLANRPLASFSLVSGAGSGQNALFGIDGNLVRSAITFDYESAPVTTANFRIRASGTPAGNVEDAFQVALLDDRTEDADGDGLTEADEEDIYGTSDTNADSDGDTLADNTEVAAGLNPTNPNTALVDALTSDPAAFGIDVGALTFGMPSIARDSATGEVTVHLRLRVSGDFENFVTVPFEQGGMTLLPSGALEFTFPSPADRAFFTLEGE